MDRVLHRLDIFYFRLNLAKSTDTTAERLCLPASALDYITS